MLQKSISGVIEPDRYPRLSARFFHTHPIKTGILWTETDTTGSPHRHRAIQFGGHRTKHCSRHCTAKKRWTDLTATASTTHAHTKNAPQLAEPMPHTPSAFSCRARPSCRKLVWHACVRACTHRCTNICAKFSTCVLAVATHTHTSESLSDQLFY